MKFKSITMENFMRYKGVRFVETEEGYLVRRAYSHRMNIMKRVGQ